MSDRVLVLDNEPSMARAIAKALERDRIQDDRIIEIRAIEMPRHDDHGLLFTNRKERRAYGSSKKHMKGLRP